MKKNSDKIAIKLRGVGKRYEIHHEKPTLVEKIVNRKSEKFWALKNINITIKKGERVAFMGPNGCGKTTLLKIISGITAPTNGSVHTQGKIVSLIDLEAGFHPDLTGIQNIYINGMIIGMSKNEINEKLKNIIDFADIPQFIDAPIFTYSQGMKLRLGFSVAIHANPQILILDENIAVGDENFSNITRQKIRQLSNEGRTIVVASHNNFFIESLCERAIWMEKGRVIKNGPTKKVIKAYLKSVSG